MSPDSRRGLLCSVRLIWTDPADGPACGGETLLPKVLFAALLLPVFSACGHRGRLLSPRAQAGVWTAPGKKVSMAPALQRNQTCTAADNSFESAQEEAQRLPPFSNVVYRSWNEHEQSSAEMFSPASFKRIESVDLEWPGVLALWDTSVCGILNNAAEFTRVFKCRTLTVGASLE